MKKKILVYSLGIVVCLAAISGIDANSEKENVIVVTQEKKVPVRNASETLDAEAISAEISLTEKIDDTEGVEKTNEYLSYYFDISLEKDGFVGGLKKICPTYEEEIEELSKEKERNAEKEIEEEKEVSEETSEESTEEATEKSTEETADEDKSQGEEATAISGAEMIKSAVIAVGKEELVQTYSEEKTEERLEFYGVHINSKKQADTDNELKKYIVCAMDLGMIDEYMAQNALDGELREEEQAEILMSVANICGKGRNYIGYSNDERIYADLRFMHGLYPTLTEEELSEISALILEDKNVQECVLKRAEYDARFLPSLTICYSHESIEHMEQLIGLLNRENIVAKVQLEPKMLITKQDIKEAEKAKKGTKDSTDNSEEKSVESIGTLKYDLVFEFETKDDMVRFSEMVDLFAKVQETEETNDKETEKHSIIADSEMEAVYMAEESEHMQAAGNTRKIEKISVENDNGILEFYCLTENTDSIKEKVLELAKEQEFSIAEIKIEKENKEEQTEELETEETESKTTETESEIIETETEEKQTVKEKDKAKKTESKEDELKEKEEKESETNETISDKSRIEEAELKLYSEKYVCNKEFFFNLGGVDVEETATQIELGENKE